MKIERKHNRWDGGNGEAGLAVIEAFIATHKVETPKPRRSRISKKHNYEFKFINR